jgi:hypothetical protein
MSAGARPSRAAAGTNDGLLLLSFARPTPGAQAREIPKSVTHHSLCT